MGFLEEYGSIQSWQISDISDRVGLSWLESVLDLEH